MALPPSTDFTGATVTEGQFKVALTSMREFIADQIGAVDGYIKLVRGTGGTRPSTTEGGWLRWNTTTLALDISVAASTWHKVVTSIIDATWALKFSYNQAALVLFKSTHTGSIATARVENDVGDYVEVERTATATIVRSSGTDPIKFYIGATAVMSIDSSGNVIALGNVTANGTP